MRILFLSHYFPPEVNAPAIRTFEHCREWARAGHEVHVITCVPSHPKGVPFKGYRRLWYQKSVMEGIHIHRVWTYLAPNEKILKRTLNYLSFVPSSVWRALRLGKFDIILATSPQFFNAVAGWFAGILKNTPWVFELRDIWPESVAAVGAVKVPIILNIFSKIELMMYRKACRVVCVTRAFVDYLTRRGIPGSKIEYIPNGVDAQFWQEGNGRKIRSLLGLQHDDVLVSYIGTVGMAHGLGTLLEAAALLRDSNRKVRFLIVGDGADLSAVRSRARDIGLENLQFTGLVPHETIRDYMAATDISLVLLRKSELFKTVLPSKMFEAMGAAKPIILGVEGEARRVLELSGGGIAVSPEDCKSLAMAIAGLADKKERRISMGIAGRSFVAREFSRKMWAERYIDSLGQTITRSL